MKYVRCDRIECKNNKNGFCKLDVIEISENKKCESGGIE